MEISISKNEQNITICVSGRIDSNTSIELADELKKLDLASVDETIFDFTYVTYISSAGLRCLLMAKKMAGQKTLKVIGVSDEVYDILEMTGFQQFVSIEKAKKEESSFIDKSIKDVLEEKYRSLPHKVFLMNDHDQYTWEEVYKTVQIIAFDLYKQGVRKGTHVGICSTNSINWVLAFFAVQKLGGIACLLNFGYTEGEFIKAFDAGDITHFVYGDIPSLLGKEAEFAKKLVEDATIINSYDIRSTINFKYRINDFNFIEGLFEDKVENDAPTVMIYTSGSTGMPKGVLLSSYNILNASEFMKKTERIGNGDRLCFITPLFHILGLCVGLFECAICDCEIFFPQDIKTKTLLMNIEKYRCTAFRSVPTMVIAIVNNADFTSEKVKSLKTCVLAGAATTEAQLLRIQEAFPTTKFFNAYGLSEMAPISMTSYDDPIASLATSCGKPIDNIEVKIMDIATHNECKPGEDGEIIVAGYNLMACYYKVNLDSQAIDGQGYLHTGDIGNIDEDGLLHITGRLKDLIIRGGENITPSEVAEPISKFEGVHDVKIVGVPHEFFGEVVCACIVMKEGYTFDEAAMRNYLQGQLTKQKLPEFYYIFDKFPMLSSGKVDSVSIKKMAAEKFGKK